MNTQIRKAKADDALAIHTVAMGWSRTTRVQQGITERQLQREGFLFYPLATENYRERIERCDHFWVAENDGQIVAYTMAYTFTEMQSFTHFTENDETLLKYFTSWGCDGRCVYLAQAARLRNRVAHGSIFSLAVSLYKHATETGSPAVICEISLEPRNGRSIASAKQSGFCQVATRTKTDPNTGEDRISGTFMRTLGYRKH